MDRERTLVDQLRPKRIRCNHCGSMEVTQTRWVPIESICPNCGFVYDITPMRYNGSHWEEDA